MKSLIECLNKNKYLAIFFNDYKLRAIVFTCISVGISIIYAAINIIVGAIELSIWYISLAGYYLLLSSLRASVIIGHRKDYIEGIHRDKIFSRRKIAHYGTVGMVLILTIIALSIAIMQMVVDNKTFRYAGLMIYVGAVYTFTKVILAIINLIKAKKKRDLTVGMIRNINIADSAVSILALQTAMFQSFAHGQNMAVANAATGAAVCIFIFFLGVFMMIKALKTLKMLKENGNE